MKFATFNCRLPKAQRGGKPGVSNVKAGGFTMIEIALCLAIIGFALISILLVLPSGMNTQRDTRQETIIGQDASELLEAIRGGARGYDDLTNYVYAITNYFTTYDNQGKIINPAYYTAHGYSGYNGYTYNDAVNLYNGTITALPAMPITNGLRIIGILSTPEFLSGNVPISSTFNTTYTSNHVVAFIRSFSGLAAEKPPQDNQIMREDTFTYRLLCVNAPVAADTNILSKSSTVFSSYNNQLANNLRELRLLFEWPQQPNGDVGGFRQTYRTTVAGQLMPTNYGAYFFGISDLYFYQSQTFTNAP